MIEFDTSQFTKWVVDKLDNISNLNVVLSNPKGNSSFPCAVVSNPLKRITKTEDGFPIEIDLSISVEYWADTKYKCMELSDSGDIQLRSMNLTRMNTTIDTFDENTKKYRYGTNYETKWNALTGAFQNRI